MYHSLYSSTWLISLYYYRSIERYAVSLLEISVFDG